MAKNASNKKPSNSDIIIAAVRKDLEIADDVAIDIPRAAVLRQAFRTAAARSLKIPSIPRTNDGEAEHALREGSRRLELAAKLRGVAGSMSPKNVRADAKAGLADSAGSYSIVASQIAEYQIKGTNAQLITSQSDVVPITIKQVIACIPNKGMRQRILARGKEAAKTSEHE